MLCALPRKRQQTAVTKRPVLNGPRRLDFSNGRSEEDSVYRNMQTRINSSRVKGEPVSDSAPKLQHAPIILSRFPNTSSLDEGVNC